MSVIRFQNVSKTFSRGGGSKLLRSYLGLLLNRTRRDPFYALKDVSFTVEHGESVAIIGSNGAGKSTLLSLVAGLTPPDAGTVEVNGRVAALLELGVGFHPELTGSENVRLNAALMGLSRQRTSEVFRDIVEFSGIGDFIDEPIRAYSAGMVLRLAFSVAIYCEPEILLIDEVLVVGDQAFQAKCIEKIREFRRQGKTLLSVSHSPEMVRAFCDRAIWIDHGRLVRTGGAAEVLEAYQRGDMVAPPTKVWIEIGAARGEREANDRVYPFEPESGTLAAFLKSMPAIDGVRVEAADAGVLRSVGERLTDLRTVTVSGEAGSAEAESAFALLRDAGFVQVWVRDRRDRAGEEFGFVSPKTAETDENARLLRRAAEIAAFRPLAPEPGWRFDVAWDEPDDATQERRRIWEHFRTAGVMAPLDVTWVEGIRTRLYLGNDQSKQLFIGGRFDPNELSLLSRVLSPGMVMVDAGANEGLYTLVAASRLGGSGAVLAFEPSPREFARLSANCRLNRFENVRLFPLALSDRNGTAALAIADTEHSLQNVLGDLPANVKLRRRVAVPLARLDDVPGIAELRRLDVLKMDVEGAEHALLRGGEVTIRKHRPLILFEYSDDLLKQQGSSSAALLAVLNGWGYRIYAFSATTGEPVAFAPGVDSLNLIAAPEDCDFPGFAAGK